MKWWTSKKKTVQTEVRIAHTFAPEELVESVAGFMDDIPHTKKAILGRLRLYLWLRGNEYWECAPIMPDEKYQAAEDLCLALGMLPTTYMPGFWR